MGRNANNDWIAEILQKKLAKSIKLVQEALSKNADRRDWAKPSWYAMNIHGLLLGGRDPSAVKAGWQQSEERTIVIVAIFRGSESPGYKAPLIIKSDRQASGSGRHTKVALSAAKFPNCKEAWILVCDERSCCQKFAQSDRLTFCQKWPIKVWFYRAKRSKLVAPARFAFYKEGLDPGVPPADHLQIWCLLGEIEQSLAQNSLEFPK